MTKLLKISEVAEVLRLKSPRIYEIIRTGELPAVRIGKRQIRIDEEVLKDWIKNGGSLSTNR